MTTLAFLGVIKGTSTIILCSLEGGMKYSMNIGERLRKRHTQDAGIMMPKVMMQGMRCSIAADGSMIEPY